MIFLRNILFLVMFFKFVNLQRSDIIKTNKKSVRCISQENINSTTFINSPLPEILESREHREFIIKSDWTYITSEDSHTEAIFDKRWQSFQLKCGNELVFRGCKTISFSIYGAHEILLGLGYETDNGYEQNVNVTLKNQWTSFTSFCKKGDHKIHLFQNNELFKTIDNRLPTLLKIRVNKQTYFKIHNYTFSQSVTKSKKPTLLKILPTTHISYFGLYVVLCSWCKLEFISNIKNLTIRSKTKQENLLKKWQHYYYEIDPNEFLNITLHRTVTANQTEGLWGFDIKLYTNTSKIACGETNWGSNYRNYCQDYVNFKETRNEDKKDTDKMEKNNRGNIKDLIASEQEDNNVVFWIVLSLILIVIISWLVFFVYIKCPMLPFRRTTEAYAHENLELVSTDKEAPN